MSKISIIKTEEAEGQVKEMLALAKSKMGMVPNLLGVMAHAPQVLSVYLNTHGSLSAGMLPAKTGEQIAVAIASVNGCDYCLSAHTAAGKMSGVTANDLVAAQEGRASDAKTQAILSLALEINSTHGKGSTKAVETARAAGLSDAEILETVAHVSINILTNSINNIVDTPIDFPKVTLIKAAA